VVLGFASSGLCILEAIYTSLIFPDIINLLLFLFGQTDQEKK